MSDPLPPDAPTDPATRDAPTDPATREAPIDAATPGPADPPSAAPSASAQPYAAQDLDAPQYTIPAYAAPSPADTASPPPAVTPATHPYATPAYAAPPGPYAVPPGRYAAPIGPYALPSAGPYAAPAGPHSAAPSSAPPPSAGGFAPPPPTSAGGPAFGMAPDGRPFPPGALDARPKALAIVALVLAGAGILLMLVGSVLGTFSLGWLTPLTLFAAFVLSLIALISRNQGGKGFGVGALVLSILGGVMTVVIAVAWIFCSFGTSYGGGDSGSENHEEYEEYVVPGITAPGTDGEPDPGAQFATPVQPTVSETAFGHESDGVWWYAVVIDSANADYVFDAYLEVHGFAADGASVASATEYAMLLSGQTVIVGYFFDVEDAEISRIDVDVPEASEATLSPADETGAFVVDGVTGSASSSGATTATGTVHARFADDQEFVALAVLARAADGTIVAANKTYIDEVPGDGTPVPFEAWFDPLAPDVTFQASAHR